MPLVSLSCSEKKTNMRTPFLILGEQILGFVKYGADGLY